jgi:hypothetical protein
MDGWSAMHVVITDEAHDGWRHFCALYGTNTTAMVEAIGLMLADLEGPEGRLPSWLRATLADSRRIAAQRASRKRHSSDDS